jgi:hypothetical protein
MDDASRVRVRQVDKQGVPSLVGGRESAGARTLSRVPTASIVDPRAVSQAAGSSARKAGLGSFSFCRFAHRFARLGSKQKGDRE